MDEETDAQLNTIFGRNVKSEFDMSAMDSNDNHQSLVLHNDEDDLPDDNSHQLDALQNVAAMFSASGGSDRLRQSNPMSRLNFHRRGGFYPQKRIVRNRPGPMCVLSILLKYIEMSNM